MRNSLGGSDLPSCLHDGQQEVSPPTGLVFVLYAYPGLPPGARLFRALRRLVHCCAEGLGGWRGAVVSVGGCLRAFERTP